MVFHNLRKARRRWGVISKLFMKTEATAWDHGIMYKAVSQTVLLHDIKKKVVMGSMLTQITVMTADHVAHGKWEYPPLVADL